MHVLLTNPLESFVFLLLNPVKWRVRRSSFYLCKATNCDWFYALLSQTKCFQYNYKLNCIPASLKGSDSKYGPSVLGSTQTQSKRQSPLWRATNLSRKEKQKAEEKKVRSDFSRSHCRRRNQTQV